MAEVFCKFIPKYEVKKDRGRNMMVTTVKRRIALLLDSAMMASSFCSMVRSWNSCGNVNVWTENLEDWGNYVIE